jgi:hypothetical protein
MPAPVNFDLKKLDKKWKHAIEFGVSGNRTINNLQIYKQALEKHLNNPDTIEIVGSYRGTPRYHYYNPTNDLWVAVDMNRDYLAGWMLGTEQIRYLLTVGKVK